MYDLNAFSYFKILNIEFTVPQMFSPQNYLSNDIFCTYMRKYSCK